MSYNLRTLLIIRKQRSSTLERFTISLSDELAADFDQWIDARGYKNRSEAVRDLLRKEIETKRLDQDQTIHSVATLSYVYNHHERNLAERLTAHQHEAHDLVVSTMHVHLDHDDCLETLFLRGFTQQIRNFAEKITAETGVRHSALNLIPVKVAALHYAHHAHFHPHS
ncbi:transcriptional regulator NikR, CopG family [Methylomonas methanica MC09]|uniref:Putative nickel-responsive regulator n=1 Tax=Methylomonas methanica (strain DSM 25384 / MC09) TaxID=857087 RepID=G0A0S6_METMM|nr:transcriptional regulator NikR, CopG family [Methylomonas methanica MC09]